MFFLIGLSNGEFSCGVRVRNRTSLLTVVPPTALPTGNNF